MEGPIKSILSKVTGYVGIIIDAIDAAINCPGGMAAILIVSYIAMFIFSAAMFGVLVSIGSPIAAYAIPAMFGLIAAGLLSVLKTTGCEQKGT